MDQSMPSEKEIFSLTGHTFLKVIDWRQNRQGDQAVAPPWWQLFKFRLFQVLVDKHDAVAFRGTIKKTGNWEQDIASTILQNAPVSKSVWIVIVQNVGPENVWIAGHSLGSSIALLVGRQMVKQRGTHLETYLFNPPFLERLSNNKLKFVVLSTWVPNLFINPSDPICSEYEGYFEHRDKMESIGARRIGKLATKHSIVSILAGAAGKKDSEAVHLIPSAYLTVNVISCRTFKEAHGINQW